MMMPNMPLRSALKLARLILISALGGVLAACGSAATAPHTPTSTGGLTPLKITCSNIVQIWPCQIAVEKGYVQQQGIEPVLTDVKAGQDAVAFLANGQLDAAVVGVSAGTFSAINQGLDIRVVSSMGLSPTTGDISALMVRSDELRSGEIKTLADLKGKRIATVGGLGAAGSYFLAQLLAKAGLTLKDVDVQNLSQGNAAIALKNKSIDAADLTAPFTTEVMEQGSAELPDFGHHAPGGGGTATLYGPRLLRQDPALGRKFMAALMMASHDLQNGHARDADNVRILAKYTKLPIETLETMDLPDFRPDLAPDTELYESMQKVFIEAGVLRLTQPLPLDRLVDNRFTTPATRSAQG